jgi:hypothetical protein
MTFDRCDLSRTPLGNPKYAMAVPHIWVVYQAGNYVEGSQGGMDTRCVFIARLSTTVKSDVNKYGK